MQRLEVSGAVRLIYNALGVRGLSVKERDFPFLPRECILPLFLFIKVKVKFTLEHSTKAHRGSRIIALLFL